MSKKKAAFSVVAVVCLAVLLAISCGGQAEPTRTEAPGATSAPALSGAELLQDRCVKCHGLDVVEEESYSQAEWEATVENMRQKGTTLTDDEAKTLVEYLAQNYGP